MTAPRHDAGYALVAAVIFMALFSMFWLEIISGHTSALQTASAMTARARLTAAADAGLAIAVQGLMARDRTRRWPIDGRTSKMDFDGISLAIRVEDERSKIPVNFMDSQSARLMFELAGVQGEALDVVTESLLDWIDEDDEPRPNGAESQYYARKFLLPSNGKMQSLDELMLVRGMSPAVYARLKPYLTLRYGQSNTATRERNALPFALAVMSGAGLNSAVVLQRQKALNGQHTAIDIPEEDNLEGQPLKILVIATDKNGGRFERATTIEIMSRRNSQPYIVRQIE
jgi:general secretion pathway protein K